MRLLNLLTRPFMWMVVVCAFGILSEKAGANEFDTLVICPPRFQKSMGRWIEYREQQGHKIKLIAPQPRAIDIRQQILNLAGAVKSTSLKHILIVGDCGDQNSRRTDLVRTNYITAKVNVRFGSLPEIATDSLYSDLDSDGLPDVSLGRIPCDTEAELETFVDRVVRYESDANQGAWKRRINCVAGVGGFGKMVDGIIEGTTKQILTDLVPGSYQTTMTYGSWASPYCPDPRRFSQEAINRFNEGCLFWVYIGHGHWNQLDRVRMPDARYRILDNQSVERLNCRQGNPIAIFLACYTGASDGRSDCLAERMLRQDNGPIAIISGTRVTMPYALSLMSLEMVHEYFHGNVQTVGELLRMAKIRMARGSDNNPKYRAMIEGMGQAFSPLPKLLKAERNEHIHLVQLMGDPLLRIKRPETIALSAPKFVVAGNKLEVQGTTSGSGKLVVELSYRRDRLKTRMPRRKEYVGTDEAFKEFQAVYEASMDQVCVREEVFVSESGEFSVELDVPSSASGPCVIQAMLVSESGLSLGSSPIDVKKRLQSRKAELKADEIQQR